LNARRLFSLIVVAFVAAGIVAHVTAAPLGQDPKERLATLTKLAASYRLTFGDKRVAKLDEAPAIRWSKPAGEIEDAALFFWTDDGRPVAASTFLWQKNVGLYHEFQSLTLGPLKGERDGESVWATRKPGVEFAPVPGAPAPAESRSKRQAQMKAMAEDFRTEAVKEPPFYAEHSVYKFRLLPKPLYRYADPGHPEREGAIFAFVQDTDPEVLLILESRVHGGGTRWEFALAPMTGWQLKGWHKDREVWSVPNRHPGHDPTQPYFVAGPFPVEEALSGR